MRQNPLKVLWTCEAAVEDWRTCPPPLRRIWLGWILPLSVMSIIALTSGRVLVGYEIHGVVWKLSLWQALASSVLEVVAGLLALRGLISVPARLWPAGERAGVHAIGLLAATPLFMASLLMIHPGLGYWAGLIGAVWAGVIWWRGMETLAPGLAPGQAPDPARARLIVLAVTAASGACLGWLAREAARLLTGLIA